MPGTAKHSRDIACARCRHRKKRCDHAKPICGECKRTGSDCLIVGSYKDSDVTTIPTKYLEQLEARIAELETNAKIPCQSIRCRDIGVQTDDQELAQEVKGIHHPTSQALSIIPIGTRGLPVENRADSHPMVTGPMDSRWADFSALNQMDEFIIPQIGIKSFMDYTSESIDQSPRDHNQNPTRNSAHQTTEFDSSFRSILQVENNQFGDITSNGSPWINDLYAAVYFANAHVQWPFLNKQKWLSWHSNPRADQPEKSWKGFFLKMVYAVGALFYSALQRDPTHLAASKSLYNAAMAHYPLDLSQPSMMLRTQASLLMILYALHSPSSKDISAVVSSAILYCTAAVSDLQKKPYLITSGDDTENNEEIISEEQTFMACYMLHEIISGGWERPISASYKSLDDKMYNLSNQIPSSISVDSAFHHLFRLRKIQADIRRHWEQMGENTQLSGSDNDQWRTAVKFRLDDWRQDIPLFANRSAAFGYLQPSWMEKLYDYTVVLLMQEKRSSLSVNDVQVILAAVTEVCLSFRQFQEEGQVMCYTWSALIFQFRAGIMLLYAYWVTPPDRRSERHMALETHEAVLACAKSLENFANRWKDAAILAETFDLLTRTVSWNPSVAGGFWVDIPSLMRLKECLELLKMQHHNKSVVAMIEDMVYMPCRTEDDTYSFDADWAFDLLN